MPESSNPQLIITHGLPVSGKSMWAEEEVARIRAANGNATRINRDDIRTHLFGEDYHQKDPTKKEMKEAEQQVSYVQDTLTDEFLAKGYTVINDDTNLNQAFLSEKKEIADKHGIPLGQEHFDVPVDECKRRNRVRAEHGGRFVPEEVIDKMADKAYGKDGRIKEFRIGEKTAYAYDRSGVAGEDEIAAYEKRQQDKLGTPRGGAVFLDLDGSAVDVREIADKYMAGKKKNYHAFHHASEHSPANDDVISIVDEAHQQGIPIVISTARGSEYAKPTIAWLEAHNIPATRLFMRKAGDFRKDYEVKPEFIGDAEKDGVFPLFAIEDNPGAIEGWKDAGVPVVEVPYHKSTPRESTKGAMRKNNVSDHEMSESAYTVNTVHSSDKGSIGGGANVYPKVEVSSPFRAGWCVRCGSKLKDPAKTIGDRCRQKA